MLTFIIGFFVGGFAGAMVTILAIASGYEERDDHPLSGIDVDTHSRTDEDHDL